MKQILVLSVIIFISIQTVYAEYANKYGIKYRFAANQNNRFLKGLKNEKYDDEEAIEIEGDNKGRIASPITIAFKETLFGENFYGSFVFDYSLPSTEKNLSPKKTSNPLDKEIIRNYLTNEDKEICSFSENSNCRISADVVSSSNIVLAYMFGGFFGNKTKRWLKFAIGPSIVYHETNIDLTICSKYEHNSTDKCIGKNIIDQSRTKEWLSSFSLNIGLYESRSSDSHFGIFNYTVSSFDTKTKFSKHAQLEYSEGILYIEILSYVSLF